jgi:hypothetical protein
MKRYITKYHIILFDTAAACNKAFFGVGDVGRLSAGTKFIVLESTGWTRSVISGNQVGWIWRSDDQLASMEVKES